MALDSPADAPPLLSVVIPTYNERETLPALAARVLDSVGDTPVELIVVDDASPDGTAQAVAELASRDRRVRLIERSGKMGLSSAVFTGAGAARGVYVCVMDADFSHDPEEVPEMLAKALEGYDVVVGSRYVAGSGFVGQPLARRAVSVVLNLGARLLLRIRTRDVLTGFALCRREVIAEMPTRYSAGGFKWLVEVLATQRGLRVYDWPIVFGERAHGSSKAGMREAVTFAVLCARLLAWQYGRLRSR